MPTLQEEYYFANEEPLGYLKTRSWWLSSNRLQEQTNYLHTNGIPFIETHGDFRDHVRDVLAQYQVDSGVALPASWTIKYDMPHELRDYLSDISEFDTLLRYQWFMNDRDMHAQLIDLAEQGYGRSVRVYDDKDTFVSHLMELAR